MAAELAHHHHDLSAATAATMRIVLPPIHRDVLARRGKQPPEPRTLDQDTAVQQIFTSDRLEEVIDVPLRRIVQLPPSGMNVSRLVLCAKFAAGGESGCANRRCRRVHATMPEADSAPATAAAATAAAAVDAGRHQVHVNYAWRNLDAVTYPRYEPGVTLEISPPNAGTWDVVDSSMVLKTKALDSSRRPLTHCAHFYLNRTCNLGPECRYIHAVYIDPSAKKHQRAPPPAGRINQAPTVAAVAAVAVAAVAAAATPAAATTPLIRTPQNGAVVSGSCDADYLPLPTVASARRATANTSPLALACATPCTGPATPSNGGAHSLPALDDLAMVMLTPKAFAAAPEQPKSYRHDPYSLVAVRRPSVGLVVTPLRRPVALAGSLSASNDSI